MFEFLVSLLGVTAVVSIIVAVLLVTKSTMRKKLTAGSRYVTWLLVVVRLCLPISVFGIPALIELPTPQVFQNDVNDAAVSPDPDISYDGILSESGVSVEQNGDNSGYIGGNVVGSTEDAVPSVTQGEQGGVSADSPSVRPEPENDAGNMGSVSDGENQFNVDVSEVIFAVWAVGAVVFFLLKIGDYIAFSRRVKKSLCFAGDEALAVYESVCREMGIKNAPALYSSKLLNGPMLIGYVRSAIVLPQIKLTDTAWKGIMTHELIHYRRRDLWIKLVAVIAGSIHWFNPMAHIAVRNMNDEMELSCDESALRNVSELGRVEYGRVMVDIMKNCKGRANSFSTQFNPNKSTAEDRIMSIIDDTKKHKGVFIVAVCLLLCAIAGSVFGCAEISDGDRGKETEKNEQSGESGGETTADETVNEEPKGDDDSKLTFPRIEYDFFKTYSAELKDENKRVFNVFHINKNVNTEGLPLYKFETYEEWKQYKNVFGTDYSMILSVFNNYKEEYFADNTLFLVHTYGPESTWYNVDNVEADNGLLKISLFTKSLTFVSNTNSHHFYTVGVKKADIKDCTQFMACEKTLDKNTIEALNKLEDDDARAVAVKAFLSKDIPALEKISGVPAGTFDSYNTLEIGEYTLSVYEERMGTRVYVTLLVEIKDRGDTIFPQGRILFEVSRNSRGNGYIVYKNELQTQSAAGYGLAGTYLRSWINNPWFDYELENLTDDYTHAGWTYSESVYYMLHEFFFQQAFVKDTRYTDDEILKMSKSIAVEKLGLTDHSGIDKLYRKTNYGAYEFIQEVYPPSARSDVISRSDNGVLVQYYADFGCTVKSHKVRYTVTPWGTEFPTDFEYEIVEKSEHEPYRFFYKELLYG